MPTPLHWFDAHLDLACIALNGRDLTQSPESAAGPWLPASITFPSLAEGRVTRCLATIFTEAGGNPSDPVSYPDGDWPAAARAGRRQLDYYLSLKQHPSRTLPRFQILIEGADIIAGPDEVPWWKQQGVVAVGLAWWKPSRYAGGNGTSLGLSPDGRALVRALDAAGIVHDLSHLSDPAARDLLDIAAGPVIASHSNARALCGGGGFGENQRHLSDDQIRSICARNGVIGLNLFSKFLRSGLAEADRASIDDCMFHVEHICDLARSRAHVGLGSDADGGFSAARLPAGIDRPRDYVRLAEALSARGWSDAEIRGFAYGNWERVFGA
jgi:membrane dipeptidase